MNDKLVTLAIHTKEKALILKRALSYENIDATIDEIHTVKSDQAQVVRVRIREADLPRALNLVEGSQVFEDMQSKVNTTDDGRKRILVPVDFSEYSIKACHLAFNLAAEIGAKVKILHVYFNPYYPTTFPWSDVFSYPEKEEKNLQTIIERVQNDMKNLCSTIDQEVAEGRFPTVNYSYVLKEGLAEEGILEFCKEYHPHILVMGTRGKNQKDIDLIGSVTAEVLEASRVPVVALPEDTHVDDLKKVTNIAFFTNFTQRDFAAFEQMMSLVVHRPLKVYMTHIATKRDTWDEIKLEGVMAYFKKNYPEIEVDYGILNGKDFNEELERYIRAKKIDMLAITTSRRNIFARLFNPSIARKMLFHTDTALLVLRG